MAIVVRCGDCGAMLKFRDDALGKRAKCTQCRRVVEIRPESQSRQAQESGDTEFREEFAEIAPVAVSRNNKRTFRPNPSPAAAVPVESRESKPVEEPSDQRIVLGVRLRVRIVVLVLLMVPIVFASRRSLPERLLACVVPLTVTGMYRTSKIRGDRFTTHFHLAFFPVTTQRCNVRGVTHINTRYGHEGSGWGTLVLFGPMQVIFGRLFDFLMPSIGGPYQIQLTTAKGRELTAWQGTTEAEFRRVLDLLLSVTRAELRSM
ncbi:MAG TPA: hypothetical protein VGP63_15570 [Planctomycetaceae bacterium]|nr:hypothetical protein [Planctomycetaceae bacterium]